MAREIKIFKSFKEQELYFLQYFADLSPSERLQHLARIQKKNNKNFLNSWVQKIEVTKEYFANGFGAS